MDFRNLCAVCRKTTTLFNYGVPSCNACITFFRRALNSNRPKKCKNGKSCYQNGPIADPNCRYCRYQKCLDVGMGTNLSVEIPNSLSADVDSLSVAMRKLSVLSDHRDNIFLHYHITDKLQFDKLTQKTLKFVKRPENLVYNSLDWTHLEQISNIDFFKKLDIMKSLDPSDKQVIIMNSFFKMGFLRITMMSYCNKKNVINFPDGTDIFPKHTELVSGFSASFLSRVRCQLISRFIDLAVTKEEMLLVTVVFLCCSDFPNLSASARSSISNYQQTFASHLFQHCLITYQQSAPARFTDLLSLCHTLNRSVLDLTNMVAVGNLNGLHSQMNEYYKDLLNFLAS